MGGGSGGRVGGGGVRVDVNGEVKFLLWFFFGFFFGGGGWAGGPIRGWGGVGGSKVWERWVMWGMGM